MFKDSVIKSWITLNYCSEYFFVSPKQKNWQFYSHCILIFYISRKKEENMESSEGTVRGVVQQHNYDWSLKSYDGLRSTLWNLEASKLRECCHMHRQQSSFVPSPSSLCPHPKFFLFNEPNPCFVFLSSKHTHTKNTHPSLGLSLLSLWLPLVLTAGELGGVSLKAGER